MQESDFSHKIEDIKHRLYEPDNKASQRRREGILHPVKYKVAEEWEQPTEQQKVMKKKSKFFKRFFIMAIIFFIGALGFAGYMYFKGGSVISSDNIDITLLGNAFSQGGEELPLQIEIINKNNASLELANLIIEYPRGASDDTEEMVRLPRESLGTINAGERIERNIKVKLFGDQGSVRNVKVKLEYHPEGSNAIITKEKEYPVTISSSPISLLIDAPDSISSNQEISLRITTSLNTTLPNDMTSLKVGYPSNFQFESAIPKPDSDNSLWNLSSLSQTTPSVIEIKGRMSGQNGDQQVFHVFVGETDLKNKSNVDVVYNSLLHTVTISRPFLEAKILVNDQDSASPSVPGGEIIRGKIFWRNNLSSRITDAKIIAHFSGNAFNESTISSSSGFYDSINDQIVWDKNTISDFSSIEPGENGYVDFSLTPVSLIGADKSLKNPQIIIDVSIKGSEPQEGFIFADINNFEKKIIRISSDFQIANSAVYLSGEFPPKAEKETRYVVTWTLSNSANGIVQAEARSSLPFYIKWIGVTSGNKENVSHNETTREIVWKIGSVQPNIGFNSTNREASFIISLTPSLSQVGSIPQLVKELYLTGQDSFTGSLIKNSRGQITTSLPNDPAYFSGSERVTK